MHVAGGARFDLLRDLRAFDALHAEGAFFHDAAHTHGDVRILDHLEQFPFVFRLVTAIRIFEPAHQIPFAIGLRDERAV